MLVRIKERVHIEWSGEFEAKMGLYQTPVLCTAVFDAVSIICVMYSCV